MGNASSHLLRDQRQTLRPTTPSTPTAPPFLRKSTLERIGETWSEHGLGHLLNPLNPEHEDRDWIRTLWEYELRSVLDHRRRELERSP